MIKKFRLKPQPPVEALRFNGENAAEIIEFVKPYESNAQFLEDKSILVSRPHGAFSIKPGAWVIKDRGDLHMIPHEQIESEFEAVDA